MKKILSLALVAVAALSLISCSAITDQAEIGGKTTFGSDGYFAEKGFMGSVSDAVGIEDAKKTKDAKVVKFTASDNYTLFNGETYKGLDKEVLFKPRGIKISSPENYYYNAEYIVVDGEKMTSYSGSGVDAKKYPTGEDLKWTKTVEYDGSEGNKYYSDYIKRYSPDNENFSKGTFQIAYVAANGKVYKVNSVNKLPTNSDTYSLTTDKDKIIYTTKYEYESTGTEYDPIEKKVKTIKYKETTETTTEFLKGGKATYSKKYTYTKDGTIQDKSYSIVGKDEKSTVTGKWTNNKGLIIVAFDDVYRKSNDSFVKNSDFYNYYYWNGIALSSAEYYGAFVDAIPAAAKNAPEK